MAATAVEQPSVVLPAGTPVSVMLEQDLSSATNKIGDTFKVSLVRDVVAGGRIVIPQGTAGQGEVTFAGGKGGFGRAGLLMVALRSLDFADGRTVALEGRARQEGKDRSGAMVATWVAVGIFAGVIKGKGGTMNRGRQIDGRTSEPATFAHDQTRAVEPAGKDTTDATTAATAVAPAGNTIAPPAETGPAQR